MATELKKISALLVTSQFDGTESVPLLQGGSNLRATLANLKEYFRDSSLVIFDEVDDSVVSVSSNPNQDESGATYAIVYLTKNNVFAERKTTSTGSVYTTNFKRSKDYELNDGNVNKKVYLSTLDNEFFIYDGNKLRGIIASNIEIMSPKLITDIKEIL